jgi:hypothetical protein
MAASDILVTPVTIYRAPVGTAIPDVDIPYGDAWGGGWVDFGYTDAPLSVNREITTLEKMVQQELSHVGEVKTAEAFAIESSLAEFTMANLAAVTGDDANTVAAVSGTVGYEEIFGGGKTLLPVYAWGFEGLYYDEDNGLEFPVRFFIWKGRAVLNGNLEFGKETQTGIPFRVKAQADRTRPRGERLYGGYKVTAEAEA